VIVVASVSCIYGLGSPIDYKNNILSIRPGMTMKRNAMLKKLVSIRYSRNDVAFERNKFRVRGDTVEIFPAYWHDKAIRVEFFGDEIDRVSEVDVVTGTPRHILNHAAVYPATHYISDPSVMEEALRDIEDEMLARVKEFEEAGKLIEAQRIKQRVMYDVESIRELGFCSGIENYSGPLSRRPSGSAPFTLLDYFPDDFLLVVDESHVTIPQVRGMYAGDRSRKSSLIEYGFRLPSAFDNRPLNFDEFRDRLNQVIYVSATPAPYERERSGQVVEQVIRPTGLVDPEVVVRPVKGQIDDLLAEINERAGRRERTLITTLTKKMAEDLTSHFQRLGVKVRYLHHSIDTLERVELIRDLRLGVFDVLVGINLLREGIDLPEVSLVAILDADKEGFLRSETSLIQIIGRAARNSEGRVILYADSVTPSMRRAIGETERRRDLQVAFNKEHGIIPRTIIKKVGDAPEVSQKYTADGKKGGTPLTEKERNELLRKLETEMKKASQMLEFEYAALLRDQIIKLKGA
jgi:excinuclease ABC subunit B